MEELEYSDEQRAALFEAIYLGLVSISALPKDLYNKTAQALKRSLYRGYGGTLLDFEFGSPDYDLLKELRENLYVFSAAKTATQVTEIQSLMMDGDKLVPLREFKKRALTMFKVYNDNWLESEYITTHTAGQAASNWQYTQKHKALFAKLRSVAILDQYTAPECRRMDGVVAPVDDPIWNHNLAPRHFRCRCHEERIDKYEPMPVTPKDQRLKIMEQNDKDMHPVFKMNPGKDRYVFSPEHAYFDIGKKYKVLARKNFNLKIPQTDEN